MSKGIGHLQREIIAALAARHGGDILTDTCGRCAWLADDVHDLRKVSREMAKTTTGLTNYEYVTSSWSASFSRATAGLAQRHMIDVLWAVPLQAAESEFAWPVAEVDGAIYMRWYSRQRRFIRV